jgi:hypothetical protein
MIKKKAKLELRGCFINVIISLFIGVISYYVFPHIIPMSKHETISVYGFSFLGLAYTYWPYLLVAGIAYSLHYFGKKFSTKVIELNNSSTKISSPLFIDICNILAIIIVSLVGYSMSSAFPSIFYYLAKFFSIVFFSFTLGFIKSISSSYVLVSNTQIIIKGLLGKDELSKEDIDNIIINEDDQNIMLQYNKGYNQCNIDAKKLNVDLDEIKKVMIQYGYLNHNKT